MKRFLVFLLAFTLTFAPLGTVSNPPAAAGEIKPTGVEMNGPEALEGYQKTLLYFIENIGQLDETVLYYARLPQSTIFITGEKVVFQVFERAWEEQVALTDNSGTPFPETKPGRIVAFSLNFQGANENVTVNALGLNEGKVNYLYGSDPARWHTGISTYREIVYRDLWPGIDLHFTGEAGNLKYELVLQPGALPETIKLAYEGIVGLEHLPDGDLLIKTAAGEFKEEKPFIYQEIDGKMVVVDGSFSLDEEQETAYGFSVGAYDPRYPLVIDPLLYATYLGGSTQDQGYGIAVDASGCAYVTGSTVSADFPVTAGAFDESYNENPVVLRSDAFVAKLNADGSALLYCTFLGGVNDDIGYDIVVDGAGCAYVTGHTFSNDFPVTAGAFDWGENGVFVTKLSADGSGLVYSARLGGGTGLGIAIDDAGCAYVTGATRWGFPTTGGTFMRRFPGGGIAGAFVTKLNADGSALVYSTYLGGSSGDSGRSIAVDGAGCAYVTGYTYSSDFPTTAGASQRVLNGSSDAFVTKLNGDGSVLLYSTYLGGSGDDECHAITVDSAGCAYVIGYTVSADFPVTAGAFDTSHNGGSDAFVTKLNPGGSALVYSTFLGGNRRDQAYGIAVDVLGNAYVAGWTGSPDFPVTGGAFAKSFNGDINAWPEPDYDIFITRLNPEGSAAPYSTYLGGSKRDYGRGLALDASGVYVTGDSSSPDFPVTGGAFGGSYGGSHRNAIVFKLDTAATADTEPNIDVSPLNHNFGDVPAGAYADRTFTVKNHGDGVLSTGEITGPASPFSIITDNASNRTLAPGMEAAITVRFTPTEVNQTINSTLVIPSDDPDENPVTVNLRGRGIDAPFLVSADLKFGVPFMVGEPFDLSITYARDESNTFLEGAHRVTVGSTSTGTLFDGDAVFSGGAATVEITINTGGSYSLRVDIAGVQGSRWQSVNISSGSGSGGKTEIVIYGNFEKEINVYEDYRVVRAYAGQNIEPNFLDSGWDFWRNDDLDPRTILSGDGTEVFSALTVKEQNYLKTLTGLQAGTEYFIDLTNHAVSTSMYEAPPVERILTGTTRTVTVQDLDPLTVLITITTWNYYTNYQPYYQVIYSIYGGYGDEPAITTASLPDGAVGSPYSATLAATGGSGTYSWSATGLPAGLEISSSGVISGTPTASGTSSVTVTVNDGIGSVSKTLNLIVRAVPADPGGDTAAGPAPQPPAGELVKKPEPPAAAPPVAGEKIVIELVIGSKNALVNGREVMMDVAPFIKPQAKRTMIPVRFVSEQLGAVVQWLPEKRQVKISRGATVILLTVDSAASQVNGKEEQLDCPPEILEGRTFVPLRFVSEGLGATVHWDRVTRTIIIEK